MAAGGATLDDVVEVGVLLTRLRRLRRHERGARAVVPDGSADPGLRRKLGAEMPGLLVSIRMTAVIA